MKTIPGGPIRLLFAAAALSGVALAQQPPAQTDPAQNGGWHRIGESNPYPAQPAAQQPAPPPPMASIPPRLTLQPGTYLTVRINQPLSSDRNQPGDAFSATLVKPVVVDGIVVAERGQTVGGRVSEAQKAGRVEGVSRLGVQLIDLPVVDGQQVPITTQLISRTGPTSTGQDAGTIAGTTAAGAAIGAAAGWGKGAAIGAGAGAAAGIIGVLLTRGHQTVIYPESVLTFRVEQPVAISTEHAQQAFRYVEPGDYQQQEAPRLQARPGPRYAPPPPPYYAPYPYYYGGFYGGYPYFGGFFYGPRVVIGIHGRRW